jgi:hypothetical protein
MITKKYKIPEASIVLDLEKKTSFQIIVTKRTLLRTTSHMRLRARDHHTSSTFIGGKGGAGPTSLHTTLEGPTEYVNARWM